MPQGFGIGVSYGQANSVSADLYYFNTVHQFHLGYCMQTSDARGNPVDDPASHGGTIESTGSYFYSVDMGYAYYLTENIPVEAIISVGRKCYYTNYLDSGFSAGGYHSIDSKKNAIGLGLDVGYNFRSLFELYAGYHTLRKIYIGVRIPIPDFIGSF